MKLVLCPVIFEKCITIKLDENQISGSRVVPSGRAENHDEANSRFSQLSVDQ